jgi:hypothetical protein
MRIFKNKWFTRFAQKNGISDDELKAIADILEAGQADVDLGGGVYKQRVARLGEGGSGGYRVIVFFKSGTRTFFVYGFAKSDQDNISREQSKNLKKDAKRLLALSDEQLKSLLANGNYQEIEENEDGKKVSE